MPRRSHAHPHAFESFNALENEGLMFISRRNALKASLAGLAGLSMPLLLRTRARAAEQGRSIPGRKSVILLWMTGGPSHIDTWDPKPDRPLKNRGPFSTIETKLPGVRICEHLPKQAAILDKITLIRSVDAKGSNHEPNKVFQTGHPEAAPRANRVGHLYPAIGSIIAKHRGANHPAMPPYVVFMKSRSHIAWAGHLGKQYDPFIANYAAKLPIYDLVGRDTGRVSQGDLFRLPSSLSMNRLRDRQSLSKAFDRLKSEIDVTGSMAAMDRYGQQAINMLTGQRAQAAFSLDQEPGYVRDRYGKHLWCQQALIARRLVEAGASFVTLDLSYHTASATWDTHGDNIPP